MSSMSRHHASIIRSQLIDSFTEISCASAPLANELLGSFPQYREAKSDPDHAFWSSVSARQMLRQSREIEHSLAPAMVFLPHCA